MVGEFLILKEDFEKVLNNYLDAKKTKFSKDNFILRFVHDSFPEDLRNIIGDNNYKIKGSVGKGGWSDCPTIAILDSEITTSTRKGFYVVYLFKADMSGFYLSFSWGSGQFRKSNLNLSTIGDAVEDVRTLIKENNIPYFNDLTFNDKMNLVSNADLPGSYELGSIVFTYYDINNIHDDETLIHDLKNYLNLYQFVKENYDGKYKPLIENNDFNENISSTQGIGDEDIKTVNYWVFSPGEGACLWDEFYEEGIMAIGWKEVGDLRNYQNKNQIKDDLIEVYNLERKPTNDALCLWQFANELKVGDIIFAKRGANELIGRGIVKSDYIYDEEKDYPHIREINWEEKGNWSFGNSKYRLPIKTLTDVTNYKGFVDTIKKAINEEDADEPINLYKPYDETDFLNEVYVSESDYITLKKLLKNKKNLIVQGAPGVGKTFMAKRLAYSIMGVKDSERVMMVQFHQSYSYEDFIQGYRPSKDGFELKNGSFYNFCKKAEDDDENDYFFIIDEINRGNLSKIFGELFMLIENDKRGEKNKIQLLYSDELFYIPKNLHIIGLMNTADRSLAMIDYALRRRFAFFDLKPGFSSDGFDLYQQKVDYIFFKNIINVMEELNIEITYDETLGEGFRIGHSYFCNLDNEDDVHEKLEYIVEYEIIPLLKEYWFDEPNKVEVWSNRLRECL